TWAGTALCTQLRDVDEGLRWCQREFGKPRAAQSPLRRTLIAWLMRARAARLGDLTEARRLAPDTDWRVMYGRRLFFEGKWEEAEEVFENEIAEVRRVGDLLTAATLAEWFAGLLGVGG